MVAINNAFATKQAITKTASKIEVVAAKLADDTSLKAPSAIVSPAETYSRTSDSIFNCDASMVKAYYIKSFFKYF